MRRLGSLPVCADLSLCLARYNFFATQINLFVWEQKYWYRKSLVGDLPLGDQLRLYESVLLIMEQKNWNIFEDFLSRTIAVLLLSSVSWKCATRTCCLFEINYMNWIKACSPFRLPFFPTGSFSVSLIWPESGFVCKYIWVSWELEVRNEVYYFCLLDFYYKMYVPLSEGKVAKHNCSFFCGVLCRHICNFKYFRVPLIQNAKGNGKHSEIIGSSSKLVLKWLESFSS